MFNTNVLAAIEDRAIIQEIVTVDPEIQSLLVQLASLPPNPEMNHWQQYEDLKKIFYHYVGWGARKKEIATTYHYASFVKFLEAILPEDEEHEEYEDEYYEELEV